MVVIVRGVRVHTFSEVVEDTLYRGHTKDPLTYKEFANYLTQTKKVDFDDVSDTIQDIWQKKKEKMSQVEEGVSREVPEIFTDGTRKLLRFFKWVVNPDGSKSQYLQIYPDKQVYVRAENLIGAAQKKYSGQEEDLFTSLEEEYDRLWTKDKLSFLQYSGAGENKIAVYTPFYEWFSSTQFKPAHGRWLNDTRFKLEEHPEPLATNIKTPSHFYFDEKTLKKGKTRTWEDWEEKIPDCLKGPFRAWVYSIFDPTNKSRQCLWMTDTGFSGKSTLQEAINLYMGTY